MAKTHYERPARSLVLSVAALCAFVLLVTVVGHFKFDGAMRQNAREAETLVLAGNAAIDAIRVKDDALGAALASNTTQFEAAKQKLRTDQNSLESNHGRVISTKSWPVTFGQNMHLNSLRRGVDALLRANSPAAAKDLSGTVAASSDAFADQMHAALHDYSAEVNQRMSRRLWVYGAIMPGGCGFLIVVLSAVSLPRALRRIRRVNDTLIRLEAASAGQAAQLEERNAALQAQKEHLRESEAELIMKTQQLEATSLGSQQAARRFEELFQGLPVACVGFSDEGRVFEWNRASSELFGHDAYRVLHEKLWNHIADPSFARKGASIVRQVFLGKEFRNTEWEYSRPDGQRRHVLGHLFPLRGVDGRILGGVAACLDVTDRKRAEEELKSSEKLFRDLIDSLHEGVLLYDETGKITVANPQAAALLGVSQSDLHGKRIEQIRDDFVDAELQPLEARRLPYYQCLKTGRPVENAAVGFRGRPGRSNEYHWFSVSAIPLFWDDEKYPYGVLTSFSEITDRLEHEEQLKAHVKALAAANQEVQQRSAQLELANAKLEALATTDGLTGLFNHRAFQERLEEELGRATAEVSLVLVDVDHFKNYNDTYGHPEGDVVLRRVATMLRSAVGNAGVTARYGGEEFAIILPGMDEATGRDFAADLCRQLAGAPWPNRQITISAGVATSGPGCVQPTDLIRLADEALYDSKRSGRNRATHAVDIRKAA